MAGKKIEKARRFVVFGEDGCSCDIVEAASGHAAAEQVMREWDLVADPGFKMYAAPLDECFAFSLVMTLGLVHV